MKLAFPLCCGMMILGLWLQVGQAQDILPDETGTLVVEEPDRSEANDDNGQAPKSQEGKVLDDSLAHAQSAIEGVSEALDSSQQAKEVSAGILKPIYLLAEALAIPAFHWIAFAIMATGVVSFALQLVLGKLVVLANMGFSLAEILSDVLGLAISLVGLVLTTQAAVENSSFTSSPAAVLSASAVGLLAGFVFYLWGQRQEIEAARGRNVEVKKK